MQSDNQRFTTWIVFLGRLKLNSLGMVNDLTDRVGTYRKLERVGSVFFLGNGFCFGNGFFSLNSWAALTNLALVGLRTVQIQWGSSNAPETLFSVGEPVRHRSLFNTRYSGQKCLFNGFPETPLRQHSLPRSGPKTLEALAGPLYLKSLNFLCRCFFGLLANKGSFSMESGGEACFESNVVWNLVFRTKPSIGLFVDIVFWKVEKLWSIEFVLFVQHFLDVFLAKAKGFWTAETLVRKEFFSVFIGDFSLFCCSLAMVQCLVENWSCWPASKDAPDGS